MKAAVLKLGRMRSDGRRSRQFESWTKLLKIGGATTAPGDPTAAHPDETCVLGQASTAPSTEVAANEDEGPRDLAARVDDLERRMNEKLDLAIESNRSPEGADVVRFHGGLRAAAALLLASVVYNSHSSLSS